MVKKKIIFGVMPKAKRRKVSSGIKISGGFPMGGLPVPQLAVNETTSFGEAIERSARELRREYPHNESSIDRKVNELKERFEAGQIHDWYDTQSELLDVAAKPVVQRPTTLKGTGRKR